MSEPCLTSEHEVDVNKSLSYRNVFKELSKLEKDFRQRETRNKIQNEELYKMNSTNKILKQHLETAYSEIEIMRNQVQELQAKLGALEVESNQEKEFCERVVQKLTAKITSMTNEHKEVLERSNILLEETKTAIQEENVKFVNSLQIKHGEELIALEQQIHQKDNNMRHLQTKLETTLTENLNLQDKLRKLEQGYLPIEAYKSQLQAFASTNEKLKTQFMHVKNECQTLYKENIVLKRNMEVLTGTVKGLKDRDDEFEEQKKLLGLSQQQLCQWKDKYNNLVGECDKLKENNAKLENKVEISNRDYCNIENHKNIVLQNQILQDLVKEMRKEREKFLSMPHAEDRIERLEHITDKLKKVITKNLLHK